MGVQAFRQELQLLIGRPGWSIPRLAKISGYHRSYLWELMAGRHNRRPSSDLVVDVDTALGAAGALIAAWERNEEEVEVGRRDLLRDVRDLGALAFVGPQALAGVEAIRHHLDSALTGKPQVEQWEQTVAEYALTFYLSDPQTLLGDLLSDLTLLAQHTIHAPDAARRTLHRAGGQLAAITAMTFACLGQHRLAGRWWISAREAADASGDLTVRLWVRGWEVANGLYERRPASLIVARAEETHAIAGGKATAGYAGTLAGLAQTQAVAGDPAASDTLRLVADITEAMPDTVAADHESMCGWPEVRLRHTQSYVYTALGQTTAAYDAQDRALELYGRDLIRERTALQLHRARCMIVDGDVTEGTTLAHTLLDDLPAEHHTQLVYSVARDALATVPACDRKLPLVADLRARLALSAVPA